MTLLLTVVPPSASPVVALPAPVVALAPQTGLVAPPVTQQLTPALPQLPTALPLGAVEATADLHSFTYEVEATATVSLATRRVALLEKITLTNVGTTPFTSLNLLHFPRAVGAWSKQTLSVDGAIVTPSYPTNLSIRVPFTTPLLPGAQAIIRLRGVIDLIASTDTFNRLDSKGDFLLLGNWTALPGKPVQRTTIGDPVSAPPALRMSTTVITDRPLPRAAVQASGQATTEPQTSGRLWRFTIEQARDTAIVINPAFREVKLTDPLSGVEIRGVATSTLRATALTRDARTALAAYTTWFGAAPFPQLRVVDSAVFGISQEHPGLILIGGNFTGAKRVYMVNHETAHQWWFALVANDQYTAPWVDETLADFSAYLLAGGRPASCSTRQIDGKPDSYGSFMGGCGAYYQTVYKRGTQMFYALADALGTETLTACLRDYVAANRFATVSSAPLVAALRDCGSAAPAILRRYLSATTLTSTP